MTQLIAFIRKEWFEQIRTGKFYILIIVFALFGILNPAMAKLTPWLFEMMAETLQEQGLIINQIEVTALTSWEQYYKNVSMMLIIMVVMFSGVLTNEYQKGTLVNMLTKGLSRWKVIAAKLVVQIIIWSICYWISYSITYFYTEYYWDNSIAKHCFLAAFWVYILGIWMIALIFLASSIFENNISVLIFVGIIFAVCYFVSMIPDASVYMPTKLMSSGNILNGKAMLKDFVKSVVVAGVTGIMAVVASIVVFNKKRV